MQINFSFRIDGRPRGRSINDEPVASFRSVSQNFFSTMGMRVLAGRGFTMDDRAGADMVAVVNQALVKRYWNGVPPIGARLGINGNEATIIGMVADVHHTGPSSTPDGEIYGAVRAVGRASGMDRAAHERRSVDGGRRSASGHARCRSESAARAHQVDGIARCR